MKAAAIPPSPLRFMKRALYPTDSGSPEVRPLKYPCREVIGTMFVPLHTKSEHSFGYGTAPVADLVERASRFRFPSLALTDLENLCGQVRFHHACRERGIRPITGVELRPGFEKESAFGSGVGRIVLLAKNRFGYES